MSHWKFIPGAETELYFTTSTVVGWIYIFTEPEYFEIIIDSLKYCQQHKGLRVAGYVIMPNHLHLICAGSKENRLSDIFRDFKHYTARDVLENLRANRRLRELDIFRRAAKRESNGNEHRFWMQGMHPIILESKSLFREKLNYIHSNPVRKEFVELPEHWLYSSARNYVLDDHSILRVECM